MRIVHALAAAAVALGATVVPTAAFAAEPAHLCGWSGNVKPLIAKADNQVRKVDVAAKAEPYFGPGVVVSDYRRVEVDLYAAPGAETSPTSARTLTDNRVAYNLTLITADGSQALASVQMRYDGLCKRTAVFRADVWVGSTGVDRPIRVNANRALVLAQAYRVDHQDTYPLTEPVSSMNLMQSTTAPPDFGKLRWYVNYDNGRGGLSILAVYMNGTVRALG